MAPFSGTSLHCGDALSVFGQTSPVAAGIERAASHLQVIGVGQIPYCRGKHILVGVATSKADTEASDAIADAGTDLQQFQPNGLAGG